MPESALVLSSPKLAERPVPRGDILPLQARGIIVAREQRVLLDVAELDFEPGGVSVILGPNGAGKSLLLRVLAGLLAPDRGEVRWAGRAADRERTPRLGFVFQKPVLLRRSALQNVRYALWAMGMSRAARLARAREALAWAALEHLADAPARVLSGGEQQRLAIARAFATEPELLLLDEPTSNLDPASTVAIEQLVRKTVARGTKVVMVTHDVGQAHRMADEVVFIHRGRIAERAAAQRFFEAPDSRAAQAFVEGRIFVD